MSVVSLCTVLMQKVLLMNLNKTWQECCATSLDVHVGDQSCSTNFAGVMTLALVLRIFTHFYFACLLSQLTPPALFN